MRRLLVSRDSSCWPRPRAPRRAREPSSVDASTGRHRCRRSSPDTTLSAWTSESGSRLEILRSWREQFEEENPNITRRLDQSATSRSYPAQIKLALNSEDGPDVAIGNLGWALDGPLIKAGLLRPLDDYAEAYGWDTRYPEVGLRQLQVLRGRHRLR